MEGKMGVMLIPVKYSFREGERLWAWKINGDSPQPCDLGRRVQYDLRI